MATTTKKPSAAALLDREQTTVRFTTSVSHGAFHVPGSFERWTTSLVIDPETGDPGDEVVVAQATCARVLAHLPDEWAPCSVRRTGRPAVVRRLRRLGLRRPGRRSCWPAGTSSRR
jgi:hypothetical protein